MKWQLMTRLAAMGRALLALASVLAVSSACVAEEESDVTYLMSVSFSVPHLDKWTVETVKQFEATPYRGMAARMPGAYTQGPIPQPEDFTSAVEAINSARIEGRQIWPWIFLNRIIAPNPEGSRRVKRKPAADFPFRGIDLDGSGGALDDFYAVWRTSLKVAKQLGTPGIVLDPEAYSDYRANRLRELAEMVGRTEEEVRTAVRRIGADVADITAAEFPNAVIWSLFTQFEREGPLSSTTQLFFDGMLTRAKEKNIPLIVVDGGETVEYCFISLADLKRQHNFRSLRVAEGVKRYDGHLVMGCTIAPWADAAERSGWMTERLSAKNSKLKTISDFEPLLVELMRRYRYFWIYAASAAPYNPLRPESAERYSPTIRKALVEARRLGPLPPPKMPTVSDMSRAMSFGKDLSADIEHWTVSGGPEASMTALSPEGDGPGVRFMVAVDTKDGNKKYPAGWLFLNRALDDTDDLAQAVGIRFQMRFHHEGKIRFGFREESGLRPQWVSIWSEKVGDWKDVAIPIELFAIEDVKAVSGLTFYVAEGWYLHGDSLTFDIRNMFFVQEAK